MKIFDFTPLFSFIIITLYFDISKWLIDFLHRIYFRMKNPVLRAGSE